MSCGFRGKWFFKISEHVSTRRFKCDRTPKTIDNDTWGTDYTFWFSKCGGYCDNYLNEIETTAKSHSRVFVVEIMGHKVGHICLQAGIAAGVDAILLPEIPYDIKVVAKKLKKIKKQEKNIQSLLVQKELLVKKIVFYRRKNTKQKLQVAKDVRLLMKSLNNYKS